MNTRVAKINALASKRDNAVRNEMARLNAEIEMLSAKCKILAPRIKELVEVANACMVNGINIGQNQKDIWPSRTNNFMTDGIYHGLGFYVGNGRHIVGIGKRGGGACCYGHAYITMDGNVECDAHSLTSYQRTLEQALTNEVGLIKSLLNGFDEFETKFYNYIDNL